MVSLAGRYPQGRMRPPRQHDRRVSQDGFRRARRLKPLPSSQNSRDQPEHGWRSEGPTLGAGPVRPGQIVLTGDLDAPLEFAAYGAARRDPAWGDLGLASVSAKEPGRLNSGVRAGRTLKTPTFTLTS